MEHKSTTPAAQPVQPAYQFILFAKLLQLLRQLLDALHQSVVERLPLAQLTKLCAGLLQLAADGAVLLAQGIQIRRCAVANLFVELAELDRAGKQLGAVLFDLLFEQGNLFELTAQCKKVRFCVQLLGVQLLGKVRFQSSQLALQDLGILGQLGVLLLQLCAAGGRLLVAFGVLANLLGQLGLLPIHLH